MGAEHIKAFSAVMLGTLTAYICVLRTTHATDINKIDWYANGGKVEITGEIAKEPDKRPTHTKYTVETKTLINGSGTVSEGISGLVLINDYDKWHRVAYGDMVKVSGILEKPGNMENFRYDRYLSRYGIHAVIYRGSVTLIERDHDFSIRRGLFAFKERFERRINRLFPEPHASFMAGLLTGSRKGIPASLTDDFNETGLTHIIAISGYNITIIIAIIGSLLFWLPPGIRFYPAVAAIIAFTVFVGAGAAVVRAAIMGILGLAALHIGRTATTRLAILWTAFFMTAWNPEIMWYDAGFQLSFLAVLGVTELAPILKVLCRKVPDILGIRESLQMTIAAQVAAAPLIIALFGKFSLIAPVTNILVVPVVPFAMLFGAASVAVSFIVFPAGQLAAYIGWICLEWIIRVANIGAAIPLASMPAKLHPVFIFAYYAALAAFLFGKHRLTTRTKEVSSRP